MLVSNHEFVKTPVGTLPKSVPAFLHTRSMKTPRNAAMPPMHRKTSLKIVAVTMCIAGACSVAFLMKQPSKQGEITSAPASPRHLTPDEVLAEIPISTGGSASESAVSEAVEKARKAPANVAVWVILGDILGQRLRDSADPTYYGFAEKAYQQALILQPSNVDAMNGMAWIAGGRHLFDASKMWATKALAINSDSADAYGILGDAALELGDYDGAFDHYQKMMDLRPDLSSWSRGAYLLWITGNKVKATTLMEKAIRAGAPFAENSAWCRAKLATMLIHDGAFAAAALVMEPSLRERSRNPHILLAAARLATAAKEFDVAEQYYQMLLEKCPSHDALVGLGDLQAIQGKMVEAEKYFVQVEALHAAHLASGVHDHMQMAKFLADHDRNPVEALRLAEQHKLTRNVLEADVLAWVYLKNGDKVRAIEAIKRALSRNTPDGEIHYHAGMIAAAAGDLASAREHLRKSMAMNPQFNPLQAPVAASMLEKISTRHTASAGQAATSEDQGSTQ